MEFCDSTAPELSRVGDLGEGVSKTAVYETSVMLRGFSHSVKAVPDTFYFSYCGWVRDDRPLIRTRDDLLELVAPCTAPPAQLLV
jgi:hypothetical protein